MNKNIHQTKSENKESNPMGYFFTLFISFITLLMLEYNNVGDFIGGLLGILVFGGIISLPISLIFKGSFQRNFTIGCLIVCILNLYGHFSLY